MAEPSEAALLAHVIEAIPNSGGGFTHYCHVCGRMGVSLAPTLPCPGPPPAKASLVSPEMKDDNAHS